MSKSHSKTILEAVGRSPIHHFPRAMAPVSRLTPSEQRGAVARARPVLQGPHCTRCRTRKGPSRDNVDLTRWRTLAALESTIDDKVNENKAEKLIG